MEKIQITRRLEFDAGHRIPNHEGQCRHLHGHRYSLEITIEGKIVQLNGASNEGMVIDFGDIKKIAQELIIEPWDHSFLVYKKDLEVVKILSSIKDHKTTFLDSIPTVENLAAIIFEILSTAIFNRYQNRVYLKKIRLYETPNCWADISKEQ